ncbi:tRNA pseudouridine(13) synthase TruD [Candidatus Woesearchaeota archaeon]|nr:tRNA pseudouridine(13) synthase TruD [Candidatus Woesearchaeota archaeon]
MKLQDITETFKEEPNYKIKSIPEDFIVKEISLEDYSKSQTKQGKFIYCLLKKKNYNTIDAIKQIASIFNLKEKQVGFAGNKDKNAITEQVISLPEINLDRLNKVQIRDIELKFLARGNESITLGHLKGNEFIITIRNLDLNDIKYLGKKIEYQYSNDKKLYTPNYFDDQRFGRKNHEIGRHIVKKEFKEAVAKLDNPLCSSYLEEKKTDYVGALKRLPLRLLRMYVNAYQSWLWNETLSLYLKKKTEQFVEVKYAAGYLVFPDEAIPDLEIPLLGFEDLPKLDKDLTEILEILKKRENLSPQDFIIKQIPELSAEGELRKAFVEVKDFKIRNTEKDDLNQEKNKVTISFFLQKGSYATIVIKKIFSEEKMI